MEKHLFNNFNDLPGTMHVFVKDWPGIVPYTVYPGFTDFPKNFRLFSLSWITPNPCPSRHGVTVTEKRQNRLFIR